MRAWQSTKDFLREFTAGPILASAELRCRPPSRWMTQAMADARRGEAITVFGPPDSDEPANGAKWTFGAAAQLDDAIAFEAAGPKSEHGRFDPSSLYAHFKFRWRTPWAGSGGEALGESGLGIDVSGRKLFLQPRFVFLSSLESPEFREHLVAIENAVPFRFNNGYFKRWVITPKRGNQGRILKVPKGWREKWTVS